MVQKILEWYDAHQRSIPWRIEKTPYSIWISEIMCQQTKIETVIPYYLKFMAQLPSIKDLAECEEETLLKLWQGLGYYNRARNLQIAAKEIMVKYNGIFPDVYEDVLSLKGIGDYTAGAILSIAYNQKYAAVDGNVLRVFSRLWKDDRDISLESTKKEFKKEIEAFIPERAGDFNQAIMDIGATICLANEHPLCSKCPLQALCRTYEAQAFKSYPVNSKKKPKTIEKLTLFLIELDGKILIRKREEQGLLKGLYEFKNMFGQKTMKEVRSMFKDQLLRIQEGPTKTHIFTHKKWIMYSYSLRLSEYSLLERERFVSLEELERFYSMPVAFLQFLPFLTR